MDPIYLDEIAPLIDSAAAPRVLGRQDALRIGYSPDAIKHKLATGRWTRLLPRTYLTSDILTWPDRLNAALTFAGPEALLSGAAALVDDGLRSVGRPRMVLVLVPRTVTARSRGWVRIRRTDRMPPPRQVPPPRRAAIARATADLALETARLDDVRAVVAEVVRRGRCSADDLRAELDAGPRQGSAHLRVAIAEVTLGSWSAPEAAAATLLRRSAVPPFEQNARIELPSGRYVLADFLWRELAAVLEIDSTAHHFAPADLDATMARHLALETAGYSVIHRSPAAIRQDPAGFVRSVMYWLASRAPS